MVLNFKNYSATTLISIGFLFLCGFFVRFVDLGTHFTHVDDIGMAKVILEYKAFFPYSAQKFQDDIQKAEFSGRKKPSYYFFKMLDRAGLLEITTRVCNWAYQITSISRYWTNAPLQFISTYYLLNKHQTYREKVFWGRVPSFVLAIISLIFGILFFLRWDYRNDWVLLIPISLLVFSWESIIYAKQMESYAIGLFCISILFYRLLQHFQKSHLALSSIFADSFLLAIFAHCQYQVLFIAPAYFLTLCAFAWKRGASPFRAVITTGSGALLFLLLVLPMCFMFLIRHLSAGVTASIMGPNGEFRFIIPATNPIDGFLYIFKFFFGNFWIVSSSNLGFIPEEHLLFSFFTSLWVFLMVMGIIRLIKSKELNHSLWALFTGGVAFTWILLIIFDKLVFSPTRHLMILLPVMTFWVFEGWRVLENNLRSRVSEKIVRIIPVFVSLAIAILFFSHFKSITDSRKDPFDQKEIESTLAEYKVDSIMAVNWTWNLSLMKDIPYRYNLFEEGFMKNRYSIKPTPAFQTWAWISHRQKLTQAGFQDMLGTIRQNQFIILNSLPTKDPKKLEKVIPQIIPTKDFNAYEVVYKKEIESDVEIEFSRRTKNGTNNLFFYILKLKDTAA